MKITTQKLSEILTRANKALADEALPDFKVLDQLSPEDQKSPHTTAEISQWIGKALGYTDVKFNTQIYFPLFKKYPEAFTPYHISKIHDIKGPLKDKTKLIDTLLTHPGLANKCLQYGCLYGKPELVQLALEHKADPHFNNNAPFRTALRQASKESFNEIYAAFQQHTTKYLGEDEALAMGSRPSEIPSMRQRIPAYKGYETFDWKKINNPATIAASPGVVKAKIASVNEAVKGIREAVISGSWRDYQEFAKTPLFQVYLQESFWVQHELLAAAVKAPPQPGHTSIIEDLFEKIMTSPALSKDNGHLALLKTLTHHRMPDAKRAIDWSQVNRLVEQVKDGNWSIQKFDDVLALAYLNNNMQKEAIALLEAAPRLMSDIPKNDEETKLLQAAITKANPAKALAANSNFVCAYWGLSNAGVTFTHHHPDMEITSQFSGAISGGHVEKAKALIPSVLKAKTYGGLNIGNELASAAPSVFKELIASLPQDTELGYAEYFAFATEKIALLPAGDSKTARFIATSQPKTIPQVVKQVNDPAFSSFVAEKAIRQNQPELLSTIPKTHYGQLKVTDIDTNQAQHLLAQFADRDNRTDAANVCKILLEAGVTQPALQIASLLQTAPLMKQFMDPRIPYPMSFHHFEQENPKAAPLVPTIKTIEEARQIIDRVLNPNPEIDID